MEFQDFETQAKRYRDLAGSRERISTSKSHLTVNTIILTRNPYPTRSYVKSLKGNLNPSSILQASNNSPSLQPPLASPLPPRLRLAVPLPQGPQLSPESKPPFSKPPDLKCESRSPGLRNLSPVSRSPSLPISDEHGILKKETTSMPLRNTEQIALPKYSQALFRVKFFRVMKITKLEKKLAVVSLLTARYPAGYNSYLVFQFLPSGFEEVYSNY
ncbi:uncharacterized protein LOC109820814 [Asparagus officinalis]|uniref:uncharacterized protein LOC109820814 n=1 Tax=Asparagus officinalis TaxID=4686 RepID=UPI00098E2D6B|nr:uncharacterized protein LOC109820814 [Asparagus officinalis]